MRARYSAFAVGDRSFLRRSWHPDTRPERVTVPDGVTWLGLEVVDRQAGGPLDQEGTVSFVARYRDAEGTPSDLRETSRFLRDGIRWLYHSAIAVP
jgi:SEC-C motif-containing protein